MTATRWPPSPNDKTFKGCCHIGVGDNDQVFYGPVQAELVKKRDRRCREVVLDEPPAIVVGPGACITTTGAPHRGVAVECPRRLAGGSPPRSS